MTNTQAKQIAFDKLDSYLNYIYPMFEGTFDENLGDGYSVTEEDFWNRYNKKQRKNKK